MAVWIHNFLTTRTQKVVVDGSFSDIAHVHVGYCVSQGTVAYLARPYLYVINDLPSSVSSNVRLFADDCQNQGRSNKITGVFDWVRTLGRYLGNEIQPLQMVCPPIEDTPG